MLLMKEEEIEKFLSSKTTGKTIYDNLSSDQQNKVNEKLKSIVKNNTAKNVFINFIFSEYCSVDANKKTYIDDINGEIIKEAVNKTTNQSTSIFKVEDIKTIFNCKANIDSEKNHKRNGGSPSASLNNYIKAIIAYAMGLIDDQDHEQYAKGTSQVNNIIDTDENTLSGGVSSSKTTIIEYKNKALPLQTIFYGSPGCGKSHEVKDLLEDNCIDDVYQFRTTFHPDSDYYSFVGSYKPRKDINGSITYGFSPQVFTKAYIQAWSNPQKAIVLVIEEINRGNCAQIFGDLFQLLDRDDNGYSEYPIDADEDLKQYLEEELDKNNEGIKGGKLKLPPNLYIIATMNTSDQSLFPMDSAFKRRWAWKYVPIDYTNSVSGDFKIKIGGKDYKWHEFLDVINKKIYKTTLSEDKKLGNFFIKGDIDEDEFVDKVMFYLWNDVLKLEYATGNNSFFKYDTNEQKDKSFTFNELFESDRTNILKGFMKKLEVEPCPNNDKDKDTNHPNPEVETEKPEATE